MTAPTYFPLLQSRQAETNALTHASGAVLASIRPVITIASEGAQDGDDARVMLDIDALAGRLAGYGGLFGIDTYEVREDQQLGASGQLPLEYAIDRMRSVGLASLPVVHPFSDAAVLAAASPVASHDGLGMVLRIDAPSMRQLGTLVAAVQGVLSATGLGEADVDLLLDFGAVSPADVNVTSLAAQALLNGLPNIEVWRNVIVAAGAFPATLDSVTANSVGTLARADAELWVATSANWSGRQLSYGDYAIAHPDIMFGGWSPAPNLRYTRATDWLVLKGQKGTPRGNYVFQDLCDDLVSNYPGSFSGAGTSWGDAEISRCASRTGGPGAAREWRGWATSHHIALVVNRLATHSAP